MDIGNLLAKELEAKPIFVVISRKRIEWALEQGKVDLVCNANPDWYGNSSQLKWTHEVFPQVEKIASANSPVMIRQIEDLYGKKIVTIHGYIYPTLESIWAQGKASRLTETRLDLMMKALSSKFADAAVVSELEFSYWAKRFPQAASQIKLQPLVITAVPTMCALSPRSRYPLTQLDQAIDHLSQSGQLKVVLQRYQWRPK